MLNKTQWLPVVAGAALAFGAGAESVKANTVQYTYHFTGADLLNVVYANGADGSTAVDNGLFEGARLLRTGQGNPMHRSYVESENGTFASRWSDYVDNNFTLDYFNLWGLDGRGANWGEDYKPFEFVSAEAPTGWSIETLNWEWGAPPAGYHTDAFPRFYSDGVQNQLSLSATPEELASLEFSVTIAFDTTDAWWGADTGGAPNQLDSYLTMWFGGWLYDAEGNYVDMYEGNILASVPTPAAALPALTMAGVLGLRRRRDTAV